MYERYKLIVNVVLGERKGEGVKMGSRCLWDPETDSYASQSFLNVSFSFYRLQVRIEYCSAMRCTPAYVVCIVLAV